MAEAAGSMPWLRQGLCAEEGGAARHCVTALGRSKKGNKRLQEYAVVGQTLQLCSGERRAGSLPKADGVGEVKLVPLNKKWETYFLSFTSGGEEGHAAGPACPHGCRAGGWHQLLVQPQGSLLCWAWVFEGDILRGEG